MKEKQKNGYHSFNIDKKDLPKFEQIKKYYENKLGLDIKGYQVMTKLFDEKIKEIGANNGNE